MLIVLTGSTQWTSAAIFDELCRSVMHRDTRYMRLSGGILACSINAFSTQYAYKRTYAINRYANKRAVYCIERYNWDRVFALLCDYAGYAIKRYAIKWDPLYCNVQYCK